MNTDVKRREELTIRWASPDGRFHCKACGRIIFSDARKPIDIVSESVRRYGTPLCEQCLADKQADEFITREDLWGDNDEEPIVDFDTSPYGWGGFGGRLN